MDSVLKFYKKITGFEPNFKKGSYAYNTWEKTMNKYKDIEKKRTYN